MKSLPLSAARRGWSKPQNACHPPAIATTCPNCNERVTFTMGPPKVNSSGRSDLSMVTMIGSCPACQSASRFFCLGSDPDNAELFIHPSPSGGKREPIEVEVEGFPDRVRRSYSDAIVSFNAGHWTQAAMMCGKALEGVVKTKAPEEKRKGTLGHLLMSFPENVDANGTIAALTDAMRRGRNIAVHFDEHLDVDEHLAELLLDLLDSVVEYVYVLPTRIAALDDSLNIEGSDDDSDT